MMSFRFDRLIFTMYSRFLFLMFWVFSWLFIKSGVPLLLLEGTRLFEKKDDVGAWLIIIFGTILLKAPISKIF